ncbi:death-associated inhibitor of apoptosis 2-like [Mercenaria mercenaria]|uniref:death-associated inhibitor of apoptosis 2-like n=1 Tax=Mercenaria mercenaria TaxID=6596 RepID=UPI00234F0526|nr:death-associated inhibitor of apoptosis 2-like [Mercenaria mercenaria]
MQKLAIRSNSSFTMSDVFQKLGYAEIDVITARTELESKGNMNPTAEEIINTILDIQEKTQNTDRNVSTQHSEEDLQAIQEENERLSKMVHCMLCVTNEADILFLPCTHHRVCKNCAKNVIFCPVCDHFIKEKVKTYRA